MNDPHHSRDALPKTVEAAVDRLCADLDSTILTKIKQTPSDGLDRLSILSVSFPRTLGEYIRRSYGLTDNARLFDSCKDHYVRWLRATNLEADEAWILQTASHMHPGTASRVIIKALWDRLAQDGRGAAT